MGHPAVPVVLLHGVGLDRSMWDGLADELTSRTERPVVAVDLPGHGAQPALQAAVALDDLVDDVAARLPERMHLVGFSVGALVAARLARRHPGRAETLTCVSSVCERTPEQSRSVRDRLEAAREDFPASAEASIRRWFPESTGVSAKHIQATRRVLLANDVTSYLRVYEVFATADQQVAEDAEHLTMPVLAVTGSEDPGSTPEMTAKLSRRAPDGRSHVVDGARHMLPVERPDELTGILLTFFEERNDERHD